MTEDVRKRLTASEPIPDEELTRLQFIHLELARAIVNKVTPRITERKVPRVRAVVIPPNQVSIRGMYNRGTEEIFIDLATLERGSTTVDAVIHELAHHTSRAEDLMEKHSNHMTKIAGYVVQLTHAGKFDELMQEVTW